MKTFSVGAIRDTNQEYGLLLPLVDHQMESLMIFLGLPLFWPYERLAYEGLAFSSFLSEDKGCRGHQHLGFSTSPDLPELVGCQR